MEDILQSIKAFLYDRASSPLFGAFILSWVGWNYRLFVILLSEETYSVKFSAIDQYINSYALAIPWTEMTVGFYAGNGIIFPLLTALAYIYLYPFAAEPVYRYSLKKQKNIVRLKKEANDSRIIDEKEARILFKKIADMQNKYDTDIGQYQKQVESLRVTIDELNNNKNSNQDISKLADQELQEIIENKEPISESNEFSNSHTPEKLSDEKLSVLKIISEHGGLMKDEDIITSSEFDKVKTEFHLEDLENNGYLSRSYNQNIRAYTTGLTTIGKKIMVDKGYAK